MRRYIITLLVIAFLVGTLFKAADQTGVRLMKMFGTVGIFLFGVIGTMALSRWQSREGLKEIEEALKALEPDAIITDWAFRRDGRPDYLVVAPGGVAAICLEDVAQSTGVNRAAVLVARSRERAVKSSAWVQERLGNGKGAVRITDDLPPDASVLPVVVLSRRMALPDHSASGVSVVNAKTLADHLRASLFGNVFDEQNRIRLTRLLRQV